MHPIIMILKQRRGFGKSHRECAALQCVAWYCSNADIRHHSFGDEKLHRSVCGQEKLVVTLDCSVLDVSICFL